MIRNNSLFILFISIVYFVGIPALQSINCISDWQDQQCIETDFASEEESEKSGNEKEEKESDEKYSGDLLSFALTQYDHLTSSTFQDYLLLANKGSSEVSTPPPKV